MDPEYDPPAACPVKDCAAEGFEDIYSLENHLLAQHTPDELAIRLAELARNLPYHHEIACQACGAYGARPGDHPLCRTCDNERP